jgi:hypothetical protein
MRWATALIWHLHMHLVWLACCIIVLMTWNATWPSGDVPGKMSLLWLISTTVCTSALRELFWSIHVTVMRHRVVFRNELKPNRVL